MLDEQFLVSGFLFTLPYSAAKTGLSRHDSVLPRRQWMHGIISAQVWQSRSEGRPQLPLPAEWPVLVQDRGNCSPRNLRLTFSSIPGSSDLLKQASMPFAVLVQPLAPTHPQEEPLQVQLPC